MAQTTHVCQNQECSFGKKGKPNVFIHRSGSNKYCSLKCYWADITGKKMEQERYHKSFGHRQKSYVPVICKECGKPFKSTRKTTQYCSVHCAAMVRGRAVKGKPRAHL